MLVLTRKVGEVLKLTDAHGQEILVTVASIRGDRVQLGITAPRDLRVERVKEDKASA